MSNLPAEDEINILYQKKACLCLNKPGGLLTQSPPGIDSLEKKLRRFIKISEQKTGNVYLGIPHRLDRPVTGAIIMCRNVRAAKRMTDQFKQRKVTKIYWAFVEGCPAESEGTWIDTMRKIPETAKAEICNATDQQAKQAKLHYRVLAKTECGSLLQIQLTTGRYHQIRLQCSEHGSPILGDSLYGASSTFGPECDDARQRHIALHARYLKFRHPMLEEMVEVTADLTSYWRQIEAWQPTWESLAIEEKSL